MQGKQSVSDYIGKEKKGLSSETALITLERSQKLDLLIHLISNLRQSLVVCGPDGIGKTTLLDELKSRKKDDWFIVDIQTSSNLSFESFQHQVLRFLILHYSDYESQDLSSTLSGLSEQSRKVVVVIDDSSLLVPGLIATLIQYSTVNECLRIIFSLTHDALEIKKNSDRAVDDCHFIDIPPLTKKQCGVFLQNLSVQPDIALSLTDINEQTIQKIYQETNGVPGKIISKLSTITNQKNIGDYKRLGIISFFAAVIAGGMGYFIFDEDSTKKDSEIVNEDKISSQIISQKDEGFEPSSAGDSLVNQVQPLTKGKQEEKEILESKDSIAKQEKKYEASLDYSNKSHVVSELKNEKPPAEVEKKKREQTNDKSITLPEQNLIVSKVNATGQGILDIEKTKSKLNSHQSKENLKISKQKTKVVETAQPFPVSEAAKKTSEIGSGNAIKSKEIDKNKAEKITNTTDNRDDSSWVLKQPKDYYTIQLMVLSRRDSVVNFLKKNQNLKHGIKFFRLNKQGKSRYVLIYGSFKEASTVSKEMKSLPAKFKKSWVRKFSHIHKKIDKTN